MNQFQKKQRQKITGMIFEVRCNIIYMFFMEFRRMFVDRNEGKE